MKDTYLKLGGLGSALCLALAVQAQTDITENYLTNPSFEADAATCVAGASSAVNNSADGLRGWNITPAGWETTSPGVALVINKDCFTDNNFGKTAIADGDFAYYQRFGWGSAASAMRQNTTQELPAGEYELTFKTKAFAANGAATTAAVSVLDAGGTALGSTSFSCEGGGANAMTNSAWNTQRITFKVEAPTVVTISAQMTWGNGGSCILYDDFRLTELPEGWEDRPVIEGGREDGVSSPTEGVITHEFVSEADMMNDLLQMVANSMQYAKNIWYNCAAPNNKNEACGYFKGNSAGQNNEDGVRTNADFAMLSAFIYKYGQGKVTLPEGMTWDEVKDMAVKSLVFGYSTHKANKFKITSNNAYWGSVSTSDHVWESSLWTMSLAYASYFLRDELSETQKSYIYNMIKAECNYELQRGIPTGYSGDTKAEENGWETNVLACALGLYPNDELAPRWYARLREFAINCYSHVDDANDNTVIDPEYDQTTVQDLYKGKNLYDDYTLQNHSYFHTSYQNVVMQELGESHLALNLFQGENPKWNTRALMHNNQAVMDEVLCRLALADGELAMPNGNDWSMFLYDQITSYTTAACFLRDPNALLLENLAYKHIKARQTTTQDGSWLLNSDIGPRRMGVEGHRVMMTYLMHEMAGTADLTPTTWEAFSKAHEDAYLFRCQNIVRANTADRFSVFSWSAGLKSYTGYVASNKPDKNKIFVPYKANNTGNILGWYTVSGKGINATPVVSGVYELNGNSYTMNGRLNVNDAALENSFTLYSTPGNAFIYMDYVEGKTNGTLTGEYGGLMAVSVDPFTKAQRTLYHAKGRVQTDASEMKTFQSNWVNIDNEVGIVNTAADNQMAFGDRQQSNSIYVGRIYPSFSASSRAFTTGEVVDRRHIIYYNNVDSATTQCLAAQAMPLTEQLPEGWNGVIACDPDNARYLLLSNYKGENRATLKGITTPMGAPVFTEKTAINDNASEATFACDIDHSIGNTLRVFLKGTALTAQQVIGDSCSAEVTNTAESATEADVTILVSGEAVNGKVDINAGETVIVSVENGNITSRVKEAGSEVEEYTDITAAHFSNPSFEEADTWATTGSHTLNGTAYNPCYLNNATPANSKWAQIFPITDWTVETGLTGGSQYAVLYSMPYSATTYCVSPSNVGNSASIMAAPARFPESGTRCLSVLNSWDNGSNALTKSITLPSGTYKLTFLARYACDNESRHVGSDQITTTSDNVNYSLCGVKFGDTEVFRYPQTANNWERIECPFVLEGTTKVTVSMGLRTTANVGAANNTRLYLDDVRLLGKDMGEIEPEPDAVTSIGKAQDTTVDIYNLQGIKVRSGVNATSMDDSLPKGIYIIGGKKTIRY